MSRTMTGAEQEKCKDYKAEVILQGRIPGYGESLAGKDLTGEWGEQRKWRGTVRL